MFKTITVTLYERTESGKDAFNAPEYTETPVSVPGVLAAPASSEAIVTDMQLHGKRLAYELYIPKGDTHDWRDCRVDFFGQSYRVYDLPKEYIEGNVPGAWNKIVKVEKYE